MDDSYKGEKKRLGKSDIIDAAMLAALSILAAWGV